MYLSEFAANELMARGSTGKVSRTDPDIIHPGASGTPGNTGVINPYTMNPHGRTQRLRGFGDASAPSVNMAQLIGVLNDLSSRVNAQAQEIANLKNVIAETNASARNAEQNVLTLAGNVEANFAAVDRQARGLADAIVALDRNMVETFSPRRNTTPGDGISPRILGGGAISTANGRTINARPRTGPPPVIAPVGDDWAQYDEVE